MDSESAVRATMGEGCSLKRRLLGAAMAVSVGLLVVAGANHPWVSVYGVNARGEVRGQLVGGVVAVGFGNRACVGVEVGGPFPGFFGSITDAGACDY